MSFTSDTKSTSVLTADSQSAAGSFTSDNKATSVLTLDSQAAAGSFTSDSKNINFLWVVGTLPWVVSFLPWQPITGQILTLDTKN